MKHCQYLVMTLSFSHMLRQAQTCRSFTSNPSKSPIRTDAIQKTVTDSEGERVIQSHGSAEESTDKMSRLLEDVVDSPVLMGMFSSVDSMEVEADMMGAKAGTSKMSESVCGGTTRYITPRQARNKKGVMMYIVNQPEDRTELTQLVKITVCHREGENCQVGGFGRHVTVCKQEYMDHKLVAISPDQSHVVIDTFSFPSCCSCHIQRSASWS